MVEPVTECMIGDCGAPPTEKVTINDHGLWLVYVVYVVCERHRQAINVLAMLPQSSDPKCGLIGLT